MQRGLLFLPFLGLFSGIMAIASGKIFAEKLYVSWSLWGLAFLAITVWLVSDSKRISTLFRRKGAKHGVSQGLSVLLAVVLGLGVAYLSKRERFNKSFDVTEEGINTLSSESVKLIDQLREKKQTISVLAFFQDEMKKNLFKKSITLYQLKGAQFDISYIDPQAEPTRAMAENITQADTVIFKLGKQESRLTSFSEEKITNALVRTFFLPFAWPLVSGSHQ